MADRHRLIAGSSSGWWLEDAIPGSVLVHPHGRTLDEAEHVWLAWVTDNASDVHGNAHRAVLGAFGKPVVLGALTAAIVIGLAEPAAGPAEDLARSMSTGWPSIRLSGTVVPGDTLTAESRFGVVERDPSGRWGGVTRTITGRDQRGRVVVTIEETARMVRARASSR